jgi:hypothetical protein
MTVALAEDPILLGNSKAIVAAVGKSALPAIGFLEFTRRRPPLLQGKAALALQENLRATCITPVSRVVLTRNPLFSNTFSIEMLSAKTSAVSSLSPT